MRYTFYEFFAGGGMARLGLGQSWQCLFANDFCAKKALVYQQNFNTSEELVVGDIANVQVSDLPGAADLAWASFPCQDLSLAGSGAGLGGKRSGTFWQFWRLITDLQTQDRAPRMIVLENVCGALTSHKGKDFNAIGDAVVKTGYRLGALVMDAIYFVPQSRPRLFIVCVRDDLTLPSTIISKGPESIWYPDKLKRAFVGLPKPVSAYWIWWSLPMPRTRNTIFADLIEDNPKSVKWHSEQETQRLIGLMSSANLEKVRMVQKENRRVVGGVYKRTRPDRQGNAVQRAEVRFDDVSGCLRTPAGGSSRQTILVVDGDSICSRLLSPREAARLMGLPDDYKLPERYNDAYHLAGDGLVVPVVRFLSENVLEPILRINPSAAQAA